MRSTTRNPSTTEVADKERESALGTLSGAMQEAGFLPFVAAQWILLRARPRFLPNATRRAYPPGVLKDQILCEKYKIVRRLGQGGMGTVYEATDLEKNILVAIKLITSVEIRDEVVTRFWREAEAASSINSPHIVKVWETGTEPNNNMPYMVMERLEGEDISGALKRTKMLPVNVTLRLCAQAAMGLARAHEMGIVHRDIKPANLFLAQTAPGEYTLKILDFGIAKVTQDAGQDADEGALTRTGSMLGSPHYMSPEQAQGLRTVDHRTDIWSLGVVMYKMLTGRTPHSGVDALGQVILAICSKPARPITELAPWVTPQLSSLIHRCLQIDPARRFQSMQELYMALSPMLGRSRMVHIDSVRPMADEEKAPVAPMPSAMPNTPPTVAGGLPLPISQQPTASALRPPSAPFAAKATVVTEQRVQAPPKEVNDIQRMKRLVLFGGLGLGLCASAGGAWALRHPPTPPAEIDTRKPSVVPVVPKPSTPVVVDPVQAGDPVAAAGDSVKASVRISPPNATAELNGAAATLVDGQLVITGPPFSHHRVVLQASGKTTEADILLTANGAVPPALRVP